MKTNRGTRFGPNGDGPHVYPSESNAGLLPYVKSVELTVESNGPGSPNSSCQSEPSVRFTDVDIIKVPPGIVLIPPLAFCHHLASRRVPAYRAPPYWRSC